MSPENVNAVAGAASPMLVVIAVALTTVISAVSALVGFIVRRAVTDTAAQLNASLLEVREEARETQREVRSLARESRDALSEQRAQLAELRARVIVTEGRIEDLRFTTRKEDTRG